MKDRREDRGRERESERARHRMGGGRLSLSQRREEAIVVVGLSVLTSDRVEHGRRDEVSVGSVSRTNRM